ncbi:MAG: hypothetical protein RLY20_25 [Verrucomicrobiota bacterium]|jgi:hypothetical protein
MNLKPIITVLVMTVASVATVVAQSSDALLNKLVEKGILNAEEAKQLKAESDKNFTTALSTKNGMPEWVTALKFNGDFRGRYDSINPGNDLAVDRSRWRYRARFGFVATIKDDLELGLRLGSGGIDSGVSTGTSPLAMNQTFQNNGSKKGIFLDQAYGKWSPLHTADWKGSLIFGKMEDPFVFSEVGQGLDSDYTPEGGALTLERKLSDSQTVRWINGAFILDEISSSSADPYLVGTQLRLDSKWSQHVSSSVGVMLFSFSNVDKLSNGSVPNVNVGNTRYIPSGTNQANAIPLYHFNPILADASVGYLFDRAPLYKGAFPVKLVGTYLVNPAAPSSADNHGWSAGFILGKAGKRGTWEFDYSYKWLGANSIWEEVVDDDFGAYWATNAGYNFDAKDASGYFTGTNVRGHVTKLSYSPTDCLTLSLKWYLTSLINEPSVGLGVDRESQINRFQVDALLKF